MVATHTFNSLSWSELNCEQVYKVWRSEPDLILILDARSRQEYEFAHIPGARFCPMEDIPRAIRQGGERLAVVITEAGQERAIAEQLQGYTNWVFMKQCHQWADLGLPLTQRTPVASLNLQRKEVVMTRDLIFHQLFEHESSTYTYLIADPVTKEAALIDPVLETVDRDLKLVDELGLKLVYVLDTHIHADHVTGAGEIRKRTGAKTAVSSQAGVDCVDIPLEDGQELFLGDRKIRVIETPGHTNTCLTFHVDNMIFTGDALLIRGCGRTDFQQGSSDKLFDSVRNRIFKLPNETIIYPGHDYRGLTSSTVGAEKQHNPRLKESITLDGFKKIMAELKLANPKKIHEAVPANLACGQPKDSRTLHPQVVDGIPEVTVDDVLAHQSAVAAKKLRLIDVRRPDEFNGEYGHIEGAELVTLGPDLAQFLQNGERSEEIVFVCRSGGRSGQATAESIRLGYKFTANMVGGMIQWTERKYPAKRD